jgi:hypothetical protein
MANWWSCFAARRDRRGDVVDMRTYPIIDVKAGGTIDGLLVAINKVIDMAARSSRKAGR